MRVLIIEDETRLAQNIAMVLREQASCAVDISGDGEDGQHMAMTNPYDLIILDLMLPKIDGLTVLKHLRQQKCKVPVLAMTALDDIEDVILGIDTGCDDYLTKPFDMRELVVRSKALIRRFHGQTSSVIEIGGLVIDTTARTVAFQGQCVVLPAMEYRLLEYLALRKGQIVSKEEILERLYDFDAERFSNVIEVYIRSLRRRFDPEAPHRLIHTARGLGYVLEPRW